MDIFCAFACSLTIFRRICFYIISVYPLLASSLAAIVSLFKSFTNRTGLEAIYVATEITKARPEATLKTKQPFGILI
jgi:hypothetical protein